MPTATLLDLVMMLLPGGCRPIPAALAGKTPAHTGTHTYSLGGLLKVKHALFAATFPDLKISRLITPNNTLFYLQSTLIHHLIDFQKTPLGWIW